MARMTLLMSYLLIVLGALVLVRTFTAGAGASLAIGYLLGPMLMAAGAGRLWLSRHLGRAEDAGKPGDDA